MKKLKNQINGLVKRSHIKRWIILYALLFLIATIITVAFFSNQQYSSEQVAIIIATPFVVSILLVYILSKLIIIKDFDELSEQEKQKMERVRQEAVASHSKLSDVLSFTASILLILGALTFFFALILAISVGLYKLVGLTNIADLVLFNVCIPSVIIAVCCITLLLFIAGIVALWPYRHRIIALFQQKLPKWEIDDNAFRVNGVKIPLHVPKVLL